MSQIINGVEQHQKREFSVRVPLRERSKRLAIMKFNGSLNVKPENWVHETVRLERENNRRQGVTAGGEIVQEFGEGSVYGKAAREEARRKKLGRQTKVYEHDKQPWKLTVEVEDLKGKAEEVNAKKPGTSSQKDEETANKPKAGKKARKFRSIREAGAGEHSVYWIFYRVGNDLEAYKVDEWYQFLPAVTYKYLDAEQAEERFQQQDKVFNQFALKAQIQKQLAEREEQDQQGHLLFKSALKIKDEDSTDEEYEGDEELDGKNECAGNGKGKKAANATVTKNMKKKQTKKRVGKKQRVEAGDEVAAYESDDGDDEGREYDYMSDSGSDTDREELNTERKIEEDLVGVAEEKGLKKSLESDEEEEEDAEENGDDDDEMKDEEDEPMEEQQQQPTGSIADGKDEKRAKALKNVEAMMAQKGGNKIVDEVCGTKEESDSDTDEDPDKEAIKSVLFMQDKRKKPGTASSSEVSRKRAGGDDLQSERMGESVEQAKKPRLEEQQGEDVIDGEISEVFIRKLLERKPHSTKQLLTKVNQRIQQKQPPNSQLGQQQGKDKRIVARLADILKKIEPYQFRKRNEAGKEVLFFSLNRTA